MHVKDPLVSSCAYSGVVSYCTEHFKGRIKVHSRFRLKLYPDMQKQKQNKKKTHEKEKRCLQVAFKHNDIITNIV